MNLDIIIPLTSASRLQSYLQRFCSRETFQLISFPLCGALPPTPLFHSLFLDSTIMKKGFLVKNVCGDFTNFYDLTSSFFPKLRFPETICISVLLLPDAAFLFLQDHQYSVWNIPVSLLLRQNLLFFHEADTEILPN